MDGIEIKLLMSFMTSSGRKVSLFVTDPREDITESEIMLYRLSSSCSIKEQLEESFIQVKSNWRKVQ